MDDDTWKEQKRDLGTPSLKSVAIHGSKWLTLSRICRSLLSVVTVFILARFLSPKDFGLFALILFIFNLTQIFLDFGMRVALVNKITVNETELNSVFWLNMAFSLFWMVCLNLAAHPLALLLGNLETETHLKVISLAFLFTGLQGVSLSLLERRFAFKNIAMADFAGSAAGAVVSVVLAYFGFRAGALTAQLTTVTLVTSFLIFVQSNWRPRLVFELVSIRQMMSFGAFSSGGQIIDFLSDNLERPIIGARLSVADLGNLTMGQQILNAPFATVVAMLRKTLFPIFASVQNDKARMRRGFLDVQHGLLVLMAPVGLGLWALANPFVDLVLGKDWQNVGVLLGYLSFGAVLRTIITVDAALLSAVGKVRFQFVWSFISLFSNLAVLLMVTPYGLNAIVAAKLALWVLLTPCYNYYALKIIDQNATEFYLTVCKPVASAVVMGLTVSQINITLATLEYGALTRLLIIPPIGAAIYGISQVLIDRERMVKLFKEARRQFAK